MARVWQNIQCDRPNQSGLIKWLATQYVRAAYLCGEGWNGGEKAGFGVMKSTDDFAGPLIERLQKLTTRHPDWTFGHLGYNLKSETENIDCAFANEDGFADLFFFVPEVVVIPEDNHLRCGASSQLALKIFLDHVSEYVVSERESNPVELSGTTSKEEYLEQCNKLLMHIHRGDIYELNYCVDFTGHTTQLFPPEIFSSLRKITEAPFSVLYREGAAWLMSASPERFLAKSGHRLWSQPIKGTIRRGVDAEEDQFLQATLYNDPKERSENVMIVDLVRNDLSRVAAKDSVHVTELFGIHTFKTVHQMISTIECRLKENISLTEIINATFPMGSMTGAPKVSAMKLAGLHEKQSRGIYSGSVGYVTPDGDFDFNVVIRSITWNSATGHVSAKTGGAITANSVPEKEYEECLLKARAMKQALNPARV